MTRMFVGSNIVDVPIPGVKGYKTEGVDLEKVNLLSLINTEVLWCESIQDNDQ